MYRMRLGARARPENVPTVREDAATRTRERDCDPMDRCAGRAQLLHKNRSNYKNEISATSEGVSLYNGSTLLHEQVVAENESRNYCTELTICVNSVQRKIKIAASNDVFVELLLD